MKTRECHIPWLWYESAMRVYIVWSGRRFLLPAPFHQFRVMSFQETAQGAVVQSATAGNGVQGFRRRFVEVHSLLVFLMAMAGHRLATCCFHHPQSGVKLRFVLF